MEGGWERRQILQTPRQHQGLQTAVHVSSPLYILGRKIDLFGVPESFKELHEQIQAGCQDGKLDFPSKQESSTRSLTGSGVWVTRNKEREEASPGPAQESGTSNCVVLCVYISAAEDREGFADAEQRQRCDTIRTKQRDQRPQDRWPDNKGVTRKVAFYNPGAPST